MQFKKIECRLNKTLSEPLIYLINLISLIIDKI